MPHNHSTTSVNTIAFSKNFEAQVNDNMSSGSQSASYDSKAPMPPCSPTTSEAADGEYNEKMAMKDQGQHHLPPRFSTIFDTKGPAPPAAPTPTRAFESYPQQSARKSGGVYIAKPLFWALLTVILFETAVLFAYTVIGLMNNMGVKIVHTNGAGAIVAGCDCNAQPINISPNFFMAPGSQVPIADISTSTTSSTSSSSTTAVPGVNASQLADIMKSVGAIKTSESTTHKPSTSITTVTPSQETVESTTVLTVDPSGSTISPRPTVTSTKFTRDDESTASLSTRDAPESTVSTTSTSIEAVEKRIRPIATNDAGIIVSAFDVFSYSPTSTPTMSITLKTHAQKANKPTQESEPEASSTVTPAAAEPSEEVSATPTTEIPEPTPECNKSHHMWGASGKVWGARVCGKPLTHTAITDS